MIERTAEVSPAEERRRTKRHPGIVFRDGTTGRRPALANGPQVWVLAEMFRERPLGDAEARWRIADEIAELMELPTESVLASIRYYLEYGDEIDEWIRDLDEYSARAKAEWLRKQSEPGG